MKYDAQYFIDKFSSIPEEEWCSGNYVAPDGKKCALGHCGFTDFNLPNDDERQLGYELFRLMTRNGVSLLEVNDGESEPFQQPTPKQRVIAALNQIKAKGN